LQNLKNNNQVYTFRQLGPSYSYEATTLNTQTLILNSLVLDYFFSQSGLLVTTQCSNKSFKEATPNGFITNNLTSTNKDVLLGFDSEFMSCFSNYTILKNNEVLYFTNFSL
jgi:hypothetical protein